MSRTGRAAKGFLTALLQYFSQILVQILLAPLVLKMAGRETLGAYAAVMQMLALLALVDVAGSWSLDRFLAQASGLEDEGARFRAVFTTARTVLLITNSFFAVMTVTLSFFLARLLHLTPGIASEARHALYVIAVWAIVKTPFAAYQGASVAKQDIAAVNLIATLINVGRSVASLVFVLAGTGLFGLMLSGTVVEACGSFLYRARFRRNHPGLMPGWGIPDKTLLRNMLSFGSYASLMNLGNRLFLSSANLLAGLTTGAVAASSFYTSQMPTMTGYNMLYRLTDSATPAIHEIYGRGEMGRLRNAFVRLIRLMLLMTIPLAAGVFLFNKDLVTCWVGQRLYAGPLLTDTLALYVAISAVQGMAILFSFVFGWIRLLAITSLLQGVVNFGAGFYLGKRLGLGGITLALVIVLIPQLVILLRKLSQALDVNIARLLGVSLLRAVIPVSVAAAAGLFVHSSIVIAYHRYWGLAEEALAFTVMYALAAYFMVMNSQDRADTRRYLSRAVHQGRMIHQRVFGTA
jgi:O-antigen/teichoic acid export membrane protein